MKNSKGMGGFKKLIDQNRIVNLESTLLPVTAASWPTIYTGLKPPEHGVPEFLILTKDYVPDVTFYDTKSNPPFYYDLAKKGIKCLVITPAMDVSLPPSQLNGNLDIITGFPLAAKTNKQYLKDAMDKFGFHGEPDIENRIARGEIGKEEAVKQYEEAISGRASVAQALISGNNYDLVYVCFTETDRGQHFFLNEPNEERYLLPLYSAVSRYVSYVMDRADAEGGAVMIFSDHGAQKVEEEFLINSWLVSEKFATLKSVGDRGTKHGIRQDFREALFRSRLRNLYERMPYHVKKVAFSIFAAFLPAGEERGYVRILPSDFDMRATKAFCAVSVLPVSSIWINDRRFKQGRIGKKGYNSLKKELISKLKGIKDAKGNPLVTRVVDGSSYYGNKTRFIPPDILFEVKRGYNIDPYHFSSSSMFMPPREASITNHTSNGIFGFYSRSKIGVKMSGVEVADIKGMVVNYFKA